MTDRDLARKSIEYRRDTVRAIMHAGAGHTGGSLSCVDILNVLYNRVLRITPQNWAAPVRDRYVQSKGHSVEALYVVLADKGFFPKASLDTLCRYRSPFIGHPTRKVPGIEMNTGGLGHGLPICVGMAIAAKRDGHDVRVVTPMSAATSRSTPSSPPSAGRSAASRATISRPSSACSPSPARPACPSASSPTR